MAIFKFFVGLRFLEKMHHEPATMNSLWNKEKRHDFLCMLTEASGNGKRIV